MQLRVEVAREAVCVERRGDAARWFADDSLLAGAHERGFLFEQREGGVDGGVVCCEDLPRGPWFGEGVRGADALGCGEHEVESADRLELARERARRAGLWVRDGDGDEAGVDDAA